MRIGDLELQIFSSMITPSPHALQHFAFCPRQFSDYDVALDTAALPAGVTVEEWI